MAASLQEQNILANVMTYLADGLHTITIGVIDPAGKPYTKSMDILSADTYGGVYIYAENTGKLDESLAKSPYVSFSGLTGCAFSHVKEINFIGTLEKADPEFAKELIREDSHASEHRHMTEDGPVEIGIYHVVSGEGVYEDINKGEFSFTL